MDITGKIPVAQVMYSSYSGRSSQSLYEVNLTHNGFAPKPAA